MTRALRTLLCVLVVAVPRSAIAQTSGGATAAPQDPSAPTGSGSAPSEAKTPDQLRAQQHFQKAKDLYQTGSYREAIAELEAARLLDPKAKDLVFNLGIVHEKLAKYDEAIVFFRQYMAMEGVTAAERVKAESVIKRIEGAKREIPVAPAAAGRPDRDAHTGAGGGDREGRSGGASGASETAPESPPNGSIDAATITAGSVAIVGLGVGTIFGILALSNRPTDFVTGRDGSYKALENKTSDAHTQAIVADVGFGTAIVAAAVTAILYFGRAKDAEPSVVPSAAPVAGGGVMLLGGSFR